MSIQVEKITKRYEKQLALNEVSLEVNPNQIIGFLGPNGAGKSTLMKIITGVIPADVGEAVVCGLKVEAEKTDFRKKIGYLPENNPLYPEMYIREYLSMAAGFYKLKNAKARVAEVIEMTGLDPEAHKKIGTLSKGYRQRVGIAQALIHNPEVLILDEPTSGLDPNQLEEIRNLIVAVSKDKTVMLSTHIMQEVEAVCNRVVIINKGNIIADGSTESIKQWSKGIGQQVRIETLGDIDKNSLLSFEFVGDVDAISEKEALITSRVESDIRPLLFNAAVEKGWVIVSMLEETRSLENVFQELTQNA